MVDAEKYSEAMDEFLLKMAQIPDLDEGDIGKALMKLCDVLRIASVDASFYHSIAPGVETTEDKRYFYRETRVDEARDFCQSEITGGGGFVVYRFCQRPTEAAWTKEEKQKILVIAKMLFIFNGRVNILKMMERNKGFLGQTLEGMFEKSDKPLAERIEEEKNKPHTVFKPTIG